MNQTAKYEQKTIKKFSELGMLMVMVMTGYNRSWPWPISVGQRFPTDRLTDRQFNRGLTEGLTGPVCTIFFLYI